MSLSDSKVGAVMATADIVRARKFYEEQLGLEVLSENMPTGPVSYKAADGTGLSVYLSPEHAGKSTATLAGWQVDGLESIVDDLIAKGVTLEQYDDEDMKTDAKGIVRFEGGMVAFVRDPDGNTHALNQFDG